MRPKCGYCEDFQDDPELIFKHRGDYVCACCLESWEGLRYNHATKRFRRVVIE